MHKFTFKVKRHEHTHHTHKLIDLMCIVCIIESSVSETEGV
nr:MAG TPA: hypothetical protein [Caudoviricetes sp.]